MSYSKFKTKSLSALGTNILKVICGKHSKFRCIFEQSSTAREKRYVRKCRTSGFSSYCLAQIWKKVYYHPSQSLNCVNNQSFRVATHTEVPQDHHKCPIFSVRAQAGFQGRYNKRVLEQDWPVNTKHTWSNSVQYFFPQVVKILHIVDVKSGTDEDGEYTECNNMTLINFVIKLIGPTHERNLTLLLLLIQVRQRVLPVERFTLQQKQIQVGLKSLKGKGESKMSCSLQKVQWSLGRIRGLHTSRRKEIPTFPCSLRA